MFKYFVFSCLLTLVWGQTEGSMLIMLDAMQQMMTGEDFDRDFYDKITSCMEQIDPDLIMVQDKYWEGMIEYWNTNGTDGDRWGSDRTQYIEYNPQITDADGMIIYEPCNYASNIAYYHDFAEMCDRYFLGGVIQRYSIPENLIKSIATGFTYMTIGSSFMHGSNTFLGYVEDNSCLMLQAYQVHQASLDTLPRNPILHDLSNSFREYTAEDMMKNITNMYLTAPVNEWVEETIAIGIPNYFLTYAAIVSGVLEVSLSSETVDTIIPILASAFNVSEYIVSFVEDIYLPEFRTATANLSLNVVQLNRFRLNVASTLIKLFYAFLWQEDAFTQNEFFLDPEINALGYELLPTVNAFANRLSTFPYYNDDFQNGTNVYPGDYLCNPVLPHAKWHLESAIGLLDLAYVADSLHNLLSTME